MKDFVGISVSDPAEKMGVGERSFQRVVLETERSRKRFEVSLENLETSRIEKRELFAAPYETERSAFLGSGLGQAQRARGEIEACETAALLELWANGAFFPMKAARDHQVDHHEELVLEADDDTLAEPAQRDDPFAFELTRARCYRPEKKRASELQLFENLTSDTRFERFEVNHDIR